MQQITSQDIRKLADLARIALTEEECVRMAEEFGSVMEHIAKIEQAPLPEVGQTHFPLTNVMREDGEPTPSGTYTEKILANAPRRRGNYLLVKKIL